MRATALNPARALNAWGWPAGWEKGEGRGGGEPNLGGPKRSELLEAPLDELLAAAAAVRDRTFGTRITYSPKVFIPLTHLCRDKCGYCTFAQPPARVVAPYLSPDEVLAIARAGAAAGCHEALFTLGERPELRYPAAAEWLAAHGYASTVDYLVAMCRLVLDETGLLPHANAGAMTPDELGRLRAGLGVAGDDARVAQPRPRLPPGLARQDARAPAGHPRGGRRARHPLHHRHPRRHRRDAGRTGSRPSRPSPPATAATATCRR